ncbi:MAG: HEAT repeat domain-containing protein [Candidatus Hydrogenedentes bacterium]|nr:HEAT repeat domain-containing protein [Candidatus Hydrogenedentota bacterium]
MRATTLVIGICLAAVLLYGCNREAEKTAPPTTQPGATAPAAGQAVLPGQAPPGGETVEQMVERWKQLAKSATRENPRLDEAGALADEIAIRDPHALLSLLDLVDDAQSTPYTKILATLSLTPVVGQHVAPRLIEMTKSEKESTTRACATNMLRQIPTEEVTAVLRQLKTDSEPRVRLYAQIGLATRDPKERQEVYALYHKPETTDDEKGTIIHALSQMPEVVDVPLMLEAAGAATMVEGVRIVAIQTLGQIGNAEQVAALTTFSQSDPSEKVRAAAQDALIQVNARVGGQNQLTVPLK